MTRCPGKKIYTTWRHAHNDMKVLLRKRYDGGNMEVYWCSECQGWHVGHRNGYKRGQRDGPRRRVL